MMMSDDSNDVQLVPFVTHDGRITSHLAADFGDYSRGFDETGYSRGFVAFDALKFDAVLVHIVDGEPARVIAWPATPGKTLNADAARFWKLPVGGRQRTWFIYDNEIVERPQHALARLRSVYAFVYGAQLSG
jgi:hypothetical protein